MTWNQVFYLVMVILMLLAMCSIILVGFIINERHKKRHRIKKQNKYNTAVGILNTDKQRKRRHVIK